MCSGCVRSRSTATATRFWCRSTRSARPATGPPTPVSTAATSMPPSCTPGRRNDDRASRTRHERGLSGAGGRLRRRSARPGPARRGTFRALAARQRVVPLTLRVLADEDTPVSLYRRVTEGTDGRGTFLLESAGEGESSRWSIIGSRARAILTERDGRARWIGDAPADVPADGDPLEALREVAAAFRAARVPQLPPFTGGLVGFIAYDAVRYWEKLVDPPPDEVGLPDLSMLLAQDVLVHDSHDSTVLLVANALNLNARPDGVDAAYDEALARLEEIGRAHV